LLAIVPVNSPSSAKRRLEPLLSAEQRAELVRAMLADVVRACLGAQSVHGILVVTPEPDLAPPGMDVILDPGVGHAHAVKLGLADPRAAPGALVVMGDCPLVRAETLDALAEAARPVALCPAQDGGTNALAMRPADAIEPAFGVASGAAVTVERARRLGYEAAVLDDPLIALDIDAPEDIRRVLDLGGGSRTQMFLDQLPR
jgi:2-phospho-L-lactate/phosphoenolpyruvate guanylyltransferase